MNSNPCIIAENLEKSFGERKVLKGLSLGVEKGEVFGLLGHNGAGKSTTIDLLLGLKEPDKGSSSILGMKASEHRKEVYEKVGVQLQQTRYQEEITVEEACIEYGSLYGNPADYTALLTQFNLQNLKKSKVSKLSGGERQKLSVVLALIGNPEIVFLDELTTGLDVVARREVWKTLKALKNRGITIFLTTHYMEEAEALCDRLCIIKAGEKVAEGKTEDVIAQSGKINLEEAYLYYMGEEELL